MSELLALAQLLLLYVAVVTSQQLRNVSPALPGVTQPTNATQSASAGVRQLQQQPVGAQNPFVQQVQQKLNNESRPAFELRPFRGGQQPSAASVVRTLLQTTAQAPHAVAQPAASAPVLKPLLPLRHELPAVTTSATTTATSSSTATPSTSTTTTTTPSTSTSTSATTTTEELTTTQESTTIQESTSTEEPTVTEESTATAASSTADTLVDSSSNSSTSNSENEETTTESSASTSAGSESTTDTTATSAQQSEETATTSIVESTETTTTSSSESESTSDVTATSRHRTENLNDDFRRSTQTTTTESDTTTVSSDTTTEKSADDQLKQASYLFGSDNWDRINPRNSSSDWIWDVSNNITEFHGAVVLHHNESSVDLVGMPTNRWYPQNQGRIGVLTGYQAGLSNKHTFSVGDDEQFSAQARFSGRLFNIEETPFPKNVSSNPEDDPSLGSVGLSLTTNEESALEFDILATNKGIWGVYARDADVLIENPQSKLRDFAIFKRLGDRRSPYEVVDCALVFDRTKNQMDYYLNGQVVWTLSDLGTLPRDEPASKLYTANRSDLVKTTPTTFEVNLVLYSWFDQYDPNNPKSPLRGIKLTDDANYYDEKAQFWDNESLQANAVWGQGSSLTIRSVRLNVNKAGTDLRNEAQD